MASEDLTRRRLLWRSLTLTAAGAAGLTARSATAFRIEEIPAGSATARLYGSRCGLPAEHRALLAELQAQLQGHIARGEAPEPAAATCPLCGCQLVVRAEVAR